LKLADALIIITQSPNDAEIGVMMAFLISYFLFLIIYFLFPSATSEDPHFVILYFLLLICYFFPLPSPLS
jgi:hypothetical protein